MIRFVILIIVSLWTLVSCSCNQENSNIPVHNDQNGDKASYTSPSCDGDSLVKYRHSMRYYSISDALNNKESVMYLELRGIDSIPKCLLQLENLRILHVFNSSITTLPEWMTQLKLLELTVLWNKFDTIPPVVNKMITLECLSISIATLDTAYDFSALENIKELRVLESNVKKIPESICKLKELRVIDFSKNPLIGFPDFSACNNQTCSITLNYCELSDSIVDRIKLPELLKYLSLEGNKIKNMPPAIVQNKSLKEINISDNDFFDMNDSLAYKLLKNNNLKRINVINTRVASDLKKGVNLSVLEILKERLLYKADK